MTGKNINLCKTKSTREDLVSYLLEDPTRSVRDIARDLGLTRQTVWKKKKELEDNDVVWGYTAVVDEEKLDNIVYMIFMKMKPLDRNLAKILISRVSGNVMSREGIRLIDLFSVNGEFDWIVRFSTCDYTNARRYYDTLRMVYEDYLLEKPVMVDVNFIMVAEGKRNPHLSKLLDFVPTVEKKN